MLLCFAFCVGNVYAIDNDGDSYHSLDSGGDDCDDDDPDRYPGAAEICDAAGTDEDCNPETFGFRDADNDGFGDDFCCNTDSEENEYCGNDCDDTRASTNRLALDVCDGLDNNCDGAIDDETSITQYVDWDLDGHGDPEEETPRVCPGEAGYSPLSNDCDDENPAIQPGALVCDPENVRGLMYCGSDGQWLAGGTCGTYEVCFVQQNGSGICLPEKGKTTPKPKT
jgi:hypothetical protein